MTRHYFDDRIRFNWGFHDATLDMERGWPNRLVNPKMFGTLRPMPDDTAYKAGYAAGVESFRATGVRVESSEPAWIKHQRNCDAVA